MSLAERILYRLALMGLAACLGAITGMVAATLLGLLLLQPLGYVLPGAVTAQALLLIAGAALGAIAGLVILHNR